MYCVHWFTTELQITLKDWRIIYKSLVIIIAEHLTLHSQPRTCIRWHLHDIQTCIGFGYFINCFVNKIANCPYSFWYNLWILNCNSQNFFFFVTVIDPTNAWWIFFPNGTYTDIFYCCCFGDSLMRGLN